MLVEALEKELGLDVVEVLITDKMIYNDKVKVISADFQELYTVDNIRKLGKQGGPKDKFRDLITVAVRAHYEKWFGMLPEVKQQVSANLDFGSMSFGSADEENEFGFGNGCDMFGNPLPSKPVAVPEPAEPAAPTASSFTFSLDEDF